MVFSSQIDFYRCFCIFKSFVSFESPSGFLYERILSACLMGTFGTNGQMSRDPSSDQQHIWEECQSQAYIASPE